MKTQHAVLSALTALMLLASCSSGDDYVPVLSLKTPNAEGGATVQQIKYAGAFTTVYRWTFSYNAGGQLTLAKAWKLTDGITEVRDDQAATYQLNYEPTRISVTTGGQAAPVQLDVADGLLASASSGNTVYRYAYSADRRLISWDVTYQNSGFNATTTKGAAALVTWTADGDIATIVYTPSMDAPAKHYTYSYTYSDARNVNGLLPELSSRALGCEGSEYMFYSGMLGKATTHLPTRLDIVYSETPDEVQTYQFRYSPTNGSAVTRLEYGDLGHVVNVEYNY